MGGYIDGAAGVAAFFKRRMTMTLSKRFMKGILGAVLVFGLLAVGCDTGGGGDTPPKVDKSALTAGIASAEKAKAGVVIGTKATVAAGLAYVSQAAWDALDAAIATATAVQNNSGATQDAVNAAVQTLSAAVTTFTGAIKTDGEKTSGFDATELTALIASAKSAKTGVQISADGADLSASVFWVTQAAMDAFDTAITTAESATGDTAYTALVSAINAFKNAQQAGKKAKTVTVTGLSADVSMIGVVLSETQKLTGDYATQTQGTTVENGSATDSLYTNAGAPWAGTGSWYVVLLTLTDDSTMTYYVSKSTKSFSGESVSIAFGDFQKAEIEAEGAIKGSVTFKNAPNPAPAVKIYAQYRNEGSSWNSVDAIGAGADVSADGVFSLPFSAKFLSDLQDGEQTLRFSLAIGSGASQYSIDLPSKEVTKSDLSGDELNVGNIGEASLASLTLSGTIKVNDGGQPIARVDIEAYGDDYLGEARLSSPAVAGQAWSITIPAQEAGAVSFSVRGYDSPNGGSSLFSKDFSPEETANVSDQSISGIVFDVGDVSIGTLKGTVSFTNIPTPAPYQISIRAEYNNGNYWQGINNGPEDVVTLDGNSGVWKIGRNEYFLSALESGEQTVRFAVNVRFTQSGSSATFATIEKTINKDSLSAIDLGSVSLATLTLSGTLKVNKGGQPLSYANISIYNETSGNYIGSVYLSSPAVAGQAWSITIPVQESGKVLFYVYGYDNNDEQALYETVSPEETENVSDKSISGIDFDFGDVGASD
jgi:hypothetical protein